MVYATSIHECVGDVSYVHLFMCGWQKSAVDQIFLVRCISTIIVFLFSFVFYVLETMWLTLLICLKTMRTRNLSYFFLLQLLVTIHYHKILRLCLVTRIFEENVKGGKPKTKIKVKEKLIN